MLFHRSDATKSNQYLDKLFPAPSLPPSALSPQRLPGSTPETLSALLRVLKDNHEHHHIYVNETRHNHIVHRALALYALGASGPMIEGYYMADSEGQRKAYDSPEQITEENFVEHLGDQDYYQGYLSFFTDRVEEKGASKALEGYVFSKEYNFQQGRTTETQPEMLFRLMTGILHPMIHVGYGLEFGLKGILAEGLAMAAVHDVCERGFYPPSFFEASADVAVDEQTAELLASLTLNSSPGSATASASSKDVHAFSILARMLKDDQFKSRAPRAHDRQWIDTLAELGTEIRRYAEQWTVNGDIEKKMEELIWTSTVIYAVGGFNGTDRFLADFHLMHLVTSSLFVSSIIPYLSPRSQVLFLRAYLTTILAWWIARGRPVLDFESFMTRTPVQPTIPIDLLPTPTATIPNTQTPNSFLPILQSAMSHSGDHVCKTQRALAHCSALYGDHPSESFKGTELEGAELLDGSVFVRAALLTADYVGWVREGQQSRRWSFEGFYGHQAGMEHQVGMGHQAGMGHRAGMGHDS
ncbi:hypothetical protein HYDPIDRAFT_90673 [Hydnomerulius pinastri MD-312]|uniref:Oxidoreductase AflY n=1 Tax=Hydnomerulius pinastri MD-312 TaxID=994086 RepID=A0A0C9WEZ7_9AGAM|nr:hypothetical protein HYDPIDRAFT_90673 [Hydnomerulius pinastri MD-312]